MGRMYRNFACICEIAIASEVGFLEETRLLVSHE
jgi:hypothetical protein